MIGKHDSRALTVTLEARFVPHFLEAFLKLLSLLSKIIENKKKHLNVKLYVHPKYLKVKYKLE